MKRMVMVNIEGEYSEEDGYRCKDQAIYIGTYEGKNEEELERARQKLVDEYLANGAATDKQPKKPRWPRNFVRAEIEISPHLIEQALREGKGTLEEPIVLTSDEVCYCIPCIVKA